MPRGRHAALFIVLLSAAHVVALDNGLGLSPPMGWRSWNCYGPEVSQRRIQSVMDAMVASREDGKSLKDLGFADVGLDDSWQACGTGIYDGFHSVEGKPLVNESKFADLRSMTEYGHARGLTAGWYANNCICGETQYNGPSEIQLHYQEDVAAIVDYGFDGVKVDHCGQFNNLSRWASLFNQTGRPVMIENCHWIGIVPRYDEATGELWCPFNYFRVSSDIEAHYDSMLTNLQAMPKWADVQKPISQPGCWAYADMLEVGNLPTVEENRAHFAAWCVTSSPLILSFDVTNDSLVDWVWPIISNPEVLAVSQQWAGHPGTLVHTKHDHMEDMAPGYIWAVECDASANSQGGWQKRSVSSDGMTYMIVNKDGLCVDVALGSPAVVAPCNESSPDQVFTFHGSGAITSARPDGEEQCLEVLGKTGPGVQRTRCFPGNPKHQRFTLSGEAWKDFGVPTDDQFPPRCLVTRKEYPFDLPAHFITWQLWAKPQPSGAVAVLVLNRAEEGLTAAVEFANLKGVFGEMFGIGEGGSVRVRDLFNRADLGSFEGSFTTDSIPAKDSRFYLLSPTAGPDLARLVARQPPLFWLMAGAPLACAAAFSAFLCARAGAGGGLDGSSKRELLPDSATDPGNSSGTSETESLESGSEWKLFGCMGSRDESDDNEVEAETTEEVPVRRVSRMSTAEPDSASQSGDLPLQAACSAPASQIVGVTALWWAAAIYVTLMFKLTAGQAAPSHAAVHASVHHGVHAHAPAGAKAPVLPPFMLTFLVNTSTGFFAWVLSRASKCYSAELPPARRDEIVKVVTLGVIQGCEIGCLNKSLQYLSISERTMLQNTNVLFMMLTAQLCNLETLTPKRLIAGALLAGGGILQGLASSRQSDDNSAEAAALRATHITGCVFMLSSMVLTSVKWSLIQFMTQRSDKESFLGQMSKLQLAARVQPITGVMCLLLAAFFELQAVLHPELWHPGLLVRVPAIAIGITVIMCSELKLVQLTSAVACGVLMNLHHVPMVLAGVAFFHDRVERESVYGFAFCILGGCFYAAARYADKSPPAH